MKGFNGTSTEDRDGMGLADLMAQIGDCEATLSHWLATEGRWEASGRTGLERTVARRAVLFYQRELHHLNRALRRRHAIEREAAASESR